MSEEEKHNFEEQLRQFMADNESLADFEASTSPQEQLFVELHQYYEWLQAGGFTASEALEFLVIYLLKLMERFM